MTKQKRLTDKQQMALEMMTCGKGFKYKDIADAVGVNPKTLWDWRNAPEFTHFQDELKRLDEERWFATVDAARQAAFELCVDKNPKIVEFILKNEGYNPTQKVEAEINKEIVINIEE
jgi:transposase-like protein